MNSRAQALSVVEEMPAEYRGADEDWAGGSAFTFIRWATPPVEATATSPAIDPEPRDLKDCSARGLLYRRDLFYTRGLGAAEQAPVELAGTILDPSTSGQFVLTLLRAEVVKLTPQHSTDAQSRYILRAFVTDPSGIENWVGTTPVYVL